MKELAKICPNCGKQNKVTAKFCESCGTALSEVMNTSEPKKSEDTSGGLMGWWNKQSTKGKAVIGIVGLCCIGLILVVGISGMMAPDKTTTNTLASTSNSSTPDSSSSTTSTSNSSSDDTSSSSSSSSSGIQIQVSYLGSWQGSYGDETGQQSVDGTGTKTFDITGNPSVVSAVFQKMDSGHGTLTVEIIQDGTVVQTKSTSAQYGVVSASASV